MPKKSKPKKGSQSGTGRAANSTKAPSKLSSGPNPKRMKSHLRSLNDGFKK